VVDYAEPLSSSGWAGPWESGDKIGLICVTPTASNCGSSTPTLGPIVWASTAVAFPKYTPGGVYFGNPNVESKCPDNTVVVGIKATGSVVTGIDYRENDDAIVYEAITNNFYVGCATIKFGTVYLTDQQSR
jgi:hypothetical protein